MKIITIFLFTLISCFNVFSISVSAQETVRPPQEPESLEAVITRILDEKMQIPEFGETQQLYQKLQLLITKGSLKDQEIIVENGNTPSVNLPDYKLNDRVIVSYSKESDGSNYFYITDYIRRGPMLVLFIVFAFLTAVIGKLRGLTSLLGMAISFGIIFAFILPKILAGSDPILIAIIGSLFIIPVTFFLSHGLNKKTLVAISATFVALIITGVLAGVFVDASKLSGFASEEAGFLQIAKGSINIKGLLLAGIIIGVLGVLDDITISQSAIVFQLKSVNPKITFKEIYNRAMDIGQDHISSMVNTLVLVYTGAALPLLLLFINNPHPFGEVINNEIIADEIIRTLVGSIGLVLAVPITTLLAAYVVTQKGGDQV